MALTFQTPPASTIKTYLVADGNITDKVISFPGVTSDSSLTPTQAKTAINDILSIVGSNTATTTKMTRTITEGTANV